MMKKSYKQLLLDYINQNPHPRQIGRYWATDLYAITKGYLQPENFFQKKEFTFEEAQRLVKGMAYEAELERILLKNNVKFLHGDITKKEIPITDEIILVVTPDFEMDDRIIETKCPTIPKYDIPDTYIYQLEAEYRATNKKVYLGIFSDPFNLTFYPFKPDERRWLKIQQNLLAFHEKLKQLALANFFDKDLDKNLDKDLKIKKKDKVKR